MSEDTSCSCLCFKRLSKFACHVHSRFRLLLQLSKEERHVWWSAETYAHVKDAVSNPSIMLVSDSPQRNNHYLYTENLSLCRLFGVSVCEGAYKRLSFLGNDTFARLKKELASKNAPLSLSEIEQKQKVMCKAVQGVVDAILYFSNLLGEQMPHVTVCDPKQRGRRRKDALAEQDPSVFDVEEDEAEDQAEDDDLDLTKSRPSNVESTKFVRNLIKIPSGLYPDKKHLYNDCRSTGKVTCSYSNFLKIWKHYLWHIVIGAYIPFAKCEECQSFRTRLLTATESELVALKKEQAIHRDLVTVARKRLAVRELMASLLPDLFLMIYVDGMDQKKTELPHTRYFTHSKNNEEAGGEPVASKLMGVHVVGHFFLTCWCFPQYKANNNVTLTSVMLAIERIAETKGSLPPYLLLQLDNSGKDNKSWLLLAFLGMLVELKIFKIVYAFFLPVGHTHVRVDQAFSVVNRRIGSQDLLTLEAMVNRVRGLFVRKGFSHKQVALYGVADFGQLLRNVTRAFGGQGEFFV